MKHYNIVVQGTVQGVWYRKSTEQEALKIGIKGFVKNQLDGSVYIEAEGDQNQLLSLLEWCKIGPQFAEVTNVTFKEDQIKNFKHFEIVR